MHIIAPKQTSIRSAGAAKPHAKISTKKALGIGAVGVGVGVAAGVPGINY